ncbi:MAG: hypothetical protein HYX84_01420 [Chloroflexi bacterium]|nr:hypothetical protein [Chloroflexota bacterium]
MTKAIQPPLPIGFDQLKKCYNTIMTYWNLNQITCGFEKKAEKLAGSSSALILKGKTVDNQPLLTKLDTIVANIPNTERTKLKKRFSDIIPDRAVEYVREFDDQFLEACVEALGWGWLKERYPSHYLNFNHPKSPDLLVKDKADQVIAAMECKKIRTSDEDRDYYKHKQGQVLEVKYGLTSSNYDENPFLRKLVDTLSRAEEQISHCGARNKFIFLDLTFDTPLEFAVLKEPTICEVLRIASELCKNGIRLVSFEQYQVEKPITGGGLP